MMKHKGYIGTVAYDADAKILYGEVVGLRDVITFQGTSVKEIEKAFHESVDDYLDFCKQRNETPEKPCSGQFVLRLPQELHRQLAAAAQARGISLNSLVKHVLQEQVPTNTVPSTRARRKTRRPASPRNRRRIGMTRSVAR